MFRLLLIIYFAVVSGIAQAQDENVVYYLFPDWSPDNQKIAFESGLEGELQIFTIDIDGKNLTQLTDTEYNDERPVWSPDGKKIAFFSNRSEKRNEQPVSLQIYVMNADGTEQRRVTHEGPALEYNVSWSPDGNQLVFQSRPEIDPGVHSLYIISTDGMERRRITDGQFNDTSPQWSPDGNLILFVQSVTPYKFFRNWTPEDRNLNRDSAEIMIFNLEEETIMPITENEIQDYDPSWNGDGSEIYYLQNDGQKKTLFREKLGEADAGAVADGDNVSDGGFVARTRLSPDGRFLVYNKEINGFQGIYIFDLELKKERLLVGGPAE
ncbi:MAG: PD40 domain-containing protein [Proteobacteria bacterium]|nr:PD40 domain-containing protein [Pseudomonadota bacterium]